MRRQLYKYINIPHVV